MNYIELFAGCGGLSLGLEAAGFDLLLANELSPMAAESFAYNILGVDLRNPDDTNLDKVKWIASQYSKIQLDLRLREDPHQAIERGKINDIAQIRKDPNSLRGSLLVGSIVGLNASLNGSPKVRKAFESGFGAGEVDLVSGGPPCQSFSMAGLRQLSNPRNSLPWAFAEFVSAVRPKIALLENVSGILNAFHSDGHRYLAWYEVSKAFAMEGYVPLCLHMNAKYAGAAQNRPRFIMIAFREDVALSLLRAGLDDYMREAILNSWSFYCVVRETQLDPPSGILHCHNVDRDEFGIFRSPILKPLIEYKKKPFTVRQAIDDLNVSGSKKSHYVNLLNSVFESKHFAPLRGMENHIPRKNSALVKARFRLYQVMGKLDPDLRKEISIFLRSCDPRKLDENEIRDLGIHLSCTTIDELNKEGNWLLNLDGGRFSPGGKNQTIDFLSRLHTKKQTQRVLDPELPAPAALSIPDDACHYHESDDQRTLTVREMARIQSFPDWFKFRSKETTGGEKRKFEVPQYTQVGNAVPPMLGKALGEVCRSLIDSA